MEYLIAADGIYRPSTPVYHRDDEYAQTSFDTLRAMQARHFWYRGRHRYLLAALDRFQRNADAPWSGVDLGGVGGWVRYLSDRRRDLFCPLALADSSEKGLDMAGELLGANVARYQVDLMNLGWRDQWDVAFLLDVIEHLPEDLEALRQARAALKPGGLLFVTTPAFQQFWSYNDDLAHHLRRYTCADFARLGEQAGLTICDARYFMFLLSPLYWLARQGRGVDDLTVGERMALLHKTHQIPPAVMNLPLTAVFAAETPLGHWLRFPWGTSVLGVFRK